MLENNEGHTAIPSPHVREPSLPVPAPVMPPLVSEQENRPEGGGIRIPRIKVIGPRPSPGSLSPDSEDAVERLVFSGTIAGQNE
jgi:hypothetical protein